MRVARLVPVLCVVSLAAAQDDFLSSLLSDAQSIYTAVTSILAPTTAATTSSTSISSPTSTSTTSSSTSPTLSSISSGSSSTSSQSITSAPTSSPSITGTPTSVAAAAATGTSSGNGGGGTNTLAIVLGCTLGALALAAFLALLWLCLRRRKRNRNSTKHRAISPNDEEIESWRHAKPFIRSEKGAHDTITPMSQRSLTAPLMSERPPQHTHTQSGQHQNPFVPIPPPARRSSRQGLNDHTEYSAHPYSPDHYSNHHTEGYIMPHSGHGDHQALETGLAGAALGGLAAHARDRHERKRSESRGRSMHEKVPYSEAEDNALPEATIDERRSGDVARASVKEPWPFMDSHKRSMDTSRSRSRSFSRGDDHFVTPDQTPAEPMPSRNGLAGAAAAGGIAGVAAQRRATARSPQRKGILKNTNSHFSSSSSSSNDQPQSQSSVSDSKHDRHSSGPHELESADVPLPPAQRERRDSALGTAAPLTAAAAHTNRPRSGSGGSKTSPSRLSLAISADEHEPPIIPSRSPKRNSLDSRARYSSATGGTAELPSGTTRHPTEMPLHAKESAIVSPPLEPQTVTETSGLMSPVSPVTENGSWSRAQAEQLGISPAGVDAKTVSQESTAVGSPPGEKYVDDSSDNSSSGLVSAIQKIFSSQRSAWDQDDDVQIVPTLSRKHDSRDVDRDRPYRNVPRRKAAPARTSAQLHSQYGELAQTDIDESKPHLLPSQRESARRSGESARSLPPQRSSQSNSMTATSMHDFAPSTPNSTTQARPRAHSRPGYGIGSGDPFDLARVRTDSSMTGISLANYVEPSSPSRPRPYRTSTGSSSSYKEPTLADLRRQVMAEDRERARKAWRRSQSRERTNSVGRFGDDKEFFDLIDETTGSGRFYTDNGHERRNSGQGDVGWAY